MIYLSSTKSIGISCLMRNKKRENNLKKISWFELVLKNCGADNLNN
jgi:hypothetical protein